MTDFSASLEVAGLLERGGAEDKVANQTRKRVFSSLRGECCVSKDHTFSGRESELRLSQHCSIYCLTKLGVALASSWYAATSSL